MGIQSANNTVVLELEAVPNIGLFSESSGMVNNVLILVNDTLYPLMVDEIDDFVKDIELSFLCDVEVYNYSSMWTHIDVRSFLYSRYILEGLRGCILIGQVPVFFYEYVYSIPSPKYFRFPWDYYYMDLDCSFLDSDGNQKADRFGTFTYPYLY